MVDRVAHRAGNDREALGRALAAEVDWIEVDLWWQYGRLLAHHEPAVWRLPLLYDRWRLRLALCPITLDELLRTAVAGPRLLLDYKGRSSRMPQAVVEALRAHGAVDRVAICGQDWAMLDATAALEPGLRVFHSLESPQQLAQLQGRPPQAPPIVAASVFHRLLTPEVMREFKERTIAVYAWTVNDLPRAKELVDLGVAGITSDRLNLLSSLRLAL